MSQTWSIKIVPYENGIRFEADVFGIAPGDPLIAEQGDLVSWNNQTSDSRRVAVDEAGTGQTDFVTNLIEKFKSSSPGYVIRRKDIDTNNPPSGAVGTVRYVTTSSAPGFASTGPETIVGTITVVGELNPEKP